MNSIAFYLPLGLEYEGKIYRKGSMHLATTEDELAVQLPESIAVNSRYRDLELLARVIDEIGDIHPVTTEILQSLYEADFLYLQFMYKNLNNEAGTKTKITCPNCSNKFMVQFEQLYKDMEIYK